MAASFADDIKHYQAAGWRAVEVWLTKLERHLEYVSVTDTLKALSDHGIALSAAAYQGGLLLAQGDQRRAHYEHYKRRLDLCATLGIHTLLLVPDFTVPVNTESVGRAVVSLAQAGQWAAAFGVRLALEFRGADPFCSCLDTALTLVEQCRESNVGICLDLFHYYKGPSKQEDLIRLTRANLFHVQVCDVAGAPRELMSDADRVMPGDGDFRPGAVLDHLREIRYDGAVSLELVNPDLWAANPRQVADVGFAALERLLNQNSTI